MTRQALEIKFKIQVGRMFKAGDHIECRINDVTHDAIVTFTRTKTNDLVVKVMNLHRDKYGQYTRDLFSSSYFYVVLDISEQEFDVDSGDADYWRRLRQRDADRQRPHILPRVVCEAMIDAEQLSLL